MAEKTISGELFCQYLRDNPDEEYDIKTMHVCRLVCKTRKERKTWENYAVTIAGVQSVRRVPYGLEIVWEDYESQNVVVGNTLEGKVYG
jgi:hypothetical protein